MKKAENATSSSSKAQEQEPDMSNSNSSSRTRRPMKREATRGLGYRFVQLGFMGAAGFALKDRKYKLGGGCIPGRVSCSRSVS